MFRTYKMLGCASRRWAFSFLPKHTTISGLPNSQPWLAKQNAASLGVCRYKNHDYYRDNSQYEYISLLGCMGALFASAKIAFAEDNTNRFNVDVYQQNMMQLIVDHFPRVNQLSENLRALIIQQLEWAQENTEYTPQADALYDATGKWQRFLHRECFRALCRIECLLLLREVNLDDPQNVNTHWQEFICHQPANDKLNKNDFIGICQDFQLLDKQQIDALIRATLIAAVPLSPEVIRQADERFGKDNYPHDSVYFSNYTVTKAPDIYLAMQGVSEETICWIQSCFPYTQEKKEEQAPHWRHGFYLENFSAFQGLPSENIAFWIHYWEVNAFGFNGHINFSGASFFTGSFWQRASILNNLIKRLSDEPELDVVSEYAAQCLKLLHEDLYQFVITHNKNIGLLACRLLMYMDQFNTIYALKLLAYMQNNLDEISVLADYHQYIFSNKQMVTYVPGVIGNVYKLVSERETDNFDSMLKAMCWYLEVCDASESTMVSFRCIDRDAAQRLIDNDFSHQETFNANGEVEYFSNTPPL